MIQKDFYYRKLFSPHFVSSDKANAFIPVRLENPFLSKSEYFSREKNEWLSLSKLLPDAIIGENGEKIEGFPVEYAEEPIRPKSNSLKSRQFDSNFMPLEIEDFDERQIEKLLENRTAVRRWKFKRKNAFDSDGVRKDFFAATFLTDTEKLTLTVTLHFFLHDENKDGCPSFPRIEDETLFFDMKNGTFSFSGWDYFASKFKEVDTDIMILGKIEELKLPCDILEETKELKLPRDILEKAYEKLIFLAEIFTGLSLPKNLENLPEKHILQDMYRLTKIPFEPKLYDVITSDEIKERGIKYKIRRDDSEIYNHFCRRAKIKSYRTLRKSYEFRPENLLTYLKIRDCGFKDINLYNRVLSDSENCNFFDGADIKHLAFFCKYSIKRRGEICTMNTIFKNIGGYEYDAMQMFAKYFRLVPKTLRKDILKDGFTQFNHDALSNIAFRAENKNITFSHTEEELRLEDSVNGYDFRLPKNSWQLCEIGTSLHNCVASYVESVKNKNCTIVYAEKGRNYKICIELKGKEVRQELTDHNEKPNEEERAALTEWHLRHGLR